MTRKDGWENSVNAPDWTDVESLMRAIGGIHEGQVGCLVSPAGIGFNGGLHVVVSAAFDVLPGSSLPAFVDIEAPWPCDKHATLTAHIFSLLYDLDSAIGKAYMQKELFE